MIVYVTNVTIETYYYILIFKEEYIAVITDYLITQYMYCFSGKKLHLIEYKLFEKI